MKRSLKLQSCLYQPYWICEEGNLAKGNGNHNNWRFSLDQVCATICLEDFGRLWNPKHPTMKAKQDLKDKHIDKEIVNLSILVPFSNSSNNNFHWQIHQYSSRKVLRCAFDSSKVNLNWGIHFREKSKVLYPSMRKKIKGIGFNYFIFYYTFTCNLSQSKLLISDQWP